MLLSRQQPFHTLPIHLHIQVVVHSCSSSMRRLAPLCASTLATSTTGNDWRVGRATQLPSTFRRLRPAARGAEHRSQPCRHYDTYRIQRPFENAQRGDYTLHGPLEPSEPRALVPRRTRHVRFTCHSAVRGAIVTLFSRTHNTCSFPASVLTSRDTRAPCWPRDRAERFAFLSACRLAFTTTALISIAFRRVRSGARNATSPTE